MPSEEAAPDEYLHRQHMVTLLDRISNEQHHALVLHHVLEMSVPEIAEDWHPARDRAQPTAPGPHRPASPGRLGRAAALR